ncbi:MAG TPA: DEAD/DEAH box helicase, partial [Roseiflexaceae bacterium]|nr:DEAD/DEAH box helicase [Roseiflexaceae bacterium]
MTVMLANSFAALDAWFAERGWAPFPFQHEVWEAYLRGESGLIHAATGAGKTYAAWLGPLAEWLAERATPGDKVPAAGKHRLRVLWITPLRALAADTAAQLKAPLEALGVAWEVETRTGDTAPALRARQ